MVGDVLWLLMGGLVLVLVFCGWPWGLAFCGLALALAFCGLVCSPLSRVVGVVLLVVGALRALGRLRWRQVGQGLGSPAPSAERRPGRPGSEGSSVGVDRQIPAGRA